MAVVAATPQSGSESALMAGLREMRKGLGVMRDGLPFVTDPSELGDGLCELVSVQAEFDALRLQLIGQAEANGVPGSIDVRTVSQYVAARTNQAGISVDQDSRLHKWLRDFPVFAAALDSTDMTLDHVRYIKSKLHNDRTSSDLRADQEQFVEWARDCGFKNFKKACAYWMVMIDPDGNEPKDQLDSNGVTISTRNGGRCRIVIDTDMATGNMITTMFEHETKKVREQDKLDGVERTIRQRRHAALFGLLEKGFRREDGSHPVTLLNIVMSQSVAEWTIQQLQDPQPGDVPVDPFDVDGRCELIDGTPVHPLLVAAVTGLYRFDVATLRRYVMDANNRIIDYSYNARVAPEHLRTASMIEHRGDCGTHGCGAPHAWLQIDHVDPHNNGGPTSLRNVQPQCGPDNRAKGASIGHRAWKDRPPPQRHRPARSTERAPGDDEDDHEC